MRTVIDAAPRPAPGPAPSRRWCRRGLTAVAGLLFGGWLIWARAAAAAAPPLPAGPWEGRFFDSAPAELLAAATAADRSGTADGGAAGMLFLDLRFSFDQAGRLSRTTRMVYRIRSAYADASWSQVVATWLPWHQETPRIRARVVTADGQEHRLDPGLFEQTTAGGADQETFEERRVLRGPLPAIAPGAVVEEEEVVADSAPLFERGTVERHPLDMGVPVRHLRLSLEAPAAMPLRYALYLLPAVTPRREAAAGRQRLVFDVDDLPRRGRPLPGLPPDAARGREIAFSSAASWGDVAQGYSRIVDRAASGADLEAWLHPAGPPGAHAAAAAGTPAAASAPAAAGAPEAGGSQLELIGRLLPRLAEIRYTAVELGEGGIVPRSPGETLRRHFGDCKDKAVLLVAALRALDIPAYVALLAAGEDESDVDPALPGFGAFNHAIVFVPGTPALWIDPTDPYARLGELPAGDQGRQALIASPGVGSLTRTPVSPSSENRVVKTREIFLADSGPARVVETIEYGGEAERRQRAYYASVQAEALRKATDEYSQTVFNAKAAAAEHSDPRDLSRPLRRRLEVAASRNGYTDDANALAGVSYSSTLDLVPDDLGADQATKTEETGKTDRADGRNGAAAGEDGDGKDEEGAEPPAEPRRVDFYFALPHTVETRYRLVPPAGFAPDPLPPGRVRELGSATLSEQYSIGDDGVITAVLRFDSGKQRLAPAELATLRAALAQLEKEKMVLLGFRQIGMAQAAAGHVREALQEFRREEEAAPAKAMPHLRAARVLLAGGLGAAARREAERAVQLEPRSAAAQRLLGWVLQHDEIGRRFGRGFHRDRALASYREAKRLDPTLADARADYAILLEHDPLGRRYARGADLAGAIAEYQGLRKDFDNHDYDDNLLVDLFYAGRAGAALELAATMKDTPNLAGIKVAATAVERGTEAAIQEAERAAADPARRLALLQTSAQTLVHLRAYAAAAGLLERAGQLSPDAASVLALAAVLRQAKPLAQIPLPANQPATVPRRSMLLFAAEHLDTERFIDLLSAPLRALAQADRRELLHAIEKEQAALSGKLNKSGLPPDQLIEIGLAAMQESVSGDDALGYRVTYRTVVGSAGRQDFFVVREAGGYRLAAFGNELSTVGLEALRRLDAKDLAGARQWLDWARELTPEPTGGDLPMPPFAALWRRGVAAGEQPARCAAAALLARGPTEQGPPILRACRAAEENGDRQVALDAALAAAAAAAKRWAELAEVGARLAAARPQAELPFVLEADALAHLGRRGEIADLARRRLAALPADRTAQRVLAEGLVRQGDLAGAERSFRALVDDPGASVQEMNSLAWLLLVRGQSGDGLALAQRAAQGAAGKVHGILHTLAALLAEQDKPREAYQVILQAIDAKSEAEPESVDWYVFGRMAEQYGLPEVARDLYARVERPEEADLESTFHLTQVRLAALAAPRAR